jgi:hypothetical protein
MSPAKLDNERTYTNSATEPPMILAPESGNILFKAPSTCQSEAGKSCKPSPDTAAGNELVDHALPAKNLFFK